VLDGMNVEYVVESKGHPREVILGGASRELRVRGRGSALARAYVVPRAEVIGDWGGVLARLVDESFEPREAVIIEKPPPAKGWLGGDEEALEWSVGEISYSLNAVEMDVALSERGFVVLSDAYFPGWVAEANGERVRIYRANGAFRAIPLEGGEYRVEMRYEPTSFRVGLAISVMSAVALLAIVVTLMAARRKEVAP